MVEKLDRWSDTAWIVFICITEVVVSCIAAVFWEELPLGSKAGIFSAVIMPFHVLEEWKFPGGLHYFYNRLPGPKDEKKRDLSRYPMSRLTDMITNIGLQWIPLIYSVIAYFRPDMSNAIALCILILCYGEVLAHTAGGITSYFWFKDKGIRTTYHPGLATSWMMWFPAGIYINTHLPYLIGYDWLWTLIVFSSYSSFVFWERKHRSRNG